MVQIVIKKILKKKRKMSLDFEFPALTRKEIIWRCLKNVIQTSEISVNFSFFLFLTKYSSLGTCLVLMVWKFFCDFINLSFFWKYRLHVNSWQQFKQNLPIRFKFFGKPRKKNLFKWMSQGCFIIQKKRKRPHIDEICDD